MNYDAGMGSILVLLNLSAASYMIDPCILFDRRRKWVDVL